MAVPIFRSAEKQDHFKKGKIKGLFPDGNSPFKE